MQAKRSHCREDHEPELYGRTFIIFTPSLFLLIALADVAWPEMVDALETVTSSARIITAAMQNA
jgi:hypothetical protein